MPIPVLTADRRSEVAEIMRDAFRDRDMADVKEERAIKTIERAIEGRK